MQTEDLTNDQLIASFKQCGILIRHHSIEAEKLMGNVKNLADMRDEYTAELIKRGFQVSFPIRPAIRVPVFCATTIS